MKIDRSKALKAGLAALAKINNRSTFSISATYLKRCFGSRYIEALRELELAGDILRGTSFSTITHKTKTVTLNFGWQNYNCQDYYNYKPVQKYLANKESKRLEKIAQDPLMEFFDRKAKLLKHKKDGYKKFHTISKDAQGRIYTNHIIQRKSYRKELTFKDTGRAIAFDLSACHPTLLAYVMKKLGSNQETYKEYTDYLSSTDFYSGFVETWNKISGKNHSRNDVKGAIMALFYGKGHFGTTFAQAFQIVLPQSFLFIQKMNRKLSGAEFSKMLQKVEQNIFHSFYNNFIIPNDISCLPEHDGFIVGIDDVSKVEIAFKNHLLNFLEEKIVKIKIEKNEPTITNTPHTPQYILPSSEIYEKIDLDNQTIIHNIDPPTRKLTI